MTSAVSYLRVSGKAQVDGDGFPRQRAAIAEHARRADVEIVQEFRDEGVSGRLELEHREGLAALLDRIESNGVRLVLVERADRLARDLMVGEVILARFRKLGVKVVAADGGTDLTVGDDNPTAKLIRQVLGAVAEFEKGVLVLKLRAARDRRRRTLGRCEGRKPFGSHPGENETLSAILKMRRGTRAKERTSFESIARALNESKVPTRAGGPWTKGVVFKIVRARAPQLTRGKEWRQRPMLRKQESVRWQGDSKHEPISESRTGLPTALDAPRPQHRQ